MPTSRIRKEAENSLSDTSKKRQATSLNRDSFSKPCHKRKSNHRPPKSRTLVAFDVSRCHGVRGSFDVSSTEAVKLGNGPSGPDSPSRDPVHARRVKCRGAFELTPTCTISRPLPRCSLSLCPSLSFYFWLSIEFFCLIFLLCFLLCFFVTSIYRKKSF